MATVAEALRQHGAAYLADHRLSTPQAKAWRAIVACRTAALGGQRLACDACGHSHWQYHSCRNRHCPQCGARAKDAWLQGRLADVLNVPYAHLVFTLPHGLNGLYGAHPRWVIDALFASAARTLTEFAAQAKWMGVADGLPAFSLVLHTWTQELAVHLHVHAVMACGVLARDGRWSAPARQPDFLFPVRALSKVYRGKFLAALAAAHKAGDLAHDPHARPDAWAQRQRQLYQHDWVVYARAPLGGPAQTLDYLSRYTHRTAIGNERIKAVTAREVVFSARADDKGGKRTVRLAGAEFVRRFLQHTLPTGLKRIRHYGVLASACKGEALACSRAALGMPAASAHAREGASEFLQRVARVDTQQCPCCTNGRLVMVESLAGQKRLLEPCATVVLEDGLPQGRGPP
jgi:Putative transposase/Transposase zinc-binding domain